MLIPDGATLEIEGIGWLTVHPAAGSASDAVNASERALAEALAAAGCESIEDVRAARQVRLEADARRRDAESRLNGIAPDGVEAIREAIDHLPEPMAFDGSIPSLAEAHLAEEKARRDLADKSARRDRAQVEAGDAHVAATRAASVFQSAEERLSRACKALGNPDDAALAEAYLAQELLGSQGALIAAVRQREASEASAPDLEAAAEARDCARSVVAAADERAQRIRIDLSGLDAAIDMYSAEAVEEELGDVDTRLGVARRTLDELTFEVSVLGRLNEALESAQIAARDRYVEPVLKELKPLIRLFWPDAEICVDAEDVLPTSLVRAGAEEALDVLSGGTQEQIALLVRLAFARKAAKSGKTAPVILDDAIVYTDDHRIELMFDALTRQAQDLQIIVLSCRQKAFQGLGGRSLTIARRAALDAA